MNTLLVILGPTAVGKTAVSIAVAQQLRSPILNADSRQIYRELPIGTAAPTPAEQAAVHHYFVGTHSITQDYNAGQYERDALQLLNQLFQTHDTIVLSGGGMMYIDALCNGLDDLPTTNPAVRQIVQQHYQKYGIPYLQQQVQHLDPDYYAIVDQHNPQRLMHALEVCMQTGKPYSTFRRRQTAERPFRIVKVGLDLPRPQLYDRINQRVLQMLQDGLEQEALSVYPQRHLNSLNTVGYKELFAYFDNQITRDQAISLIQQHSRNYAKRQLTWFRRDPNIHWLNPTNLTPNQIINLL